MGFSNLSVFCLLICVITFTFMNETIQLKLHFRAAFIFFVLLFNTEILSNIGDKILEELRKGKS